MGRNAWTGAIMTGVVCAVIGLSSNVARSQAAGGRAVAVLDVVRIFKDTAQIKDLNERMRQKTEDYTAELKQRSEALNSKKLELQAFKPGTADYETRRKELLKMNIEAQAWAKAVEEDLEQQKFDWTVEVYRLAVEMAGKIAKDRGFDVVLQRTDFNPQDIQDRNVQALRSTIQGRSVIYHSPDVDITDDVIRALDAAYKAKAGTTGATTGSGPTQPPKPPSTTNPPKR